MREHHRGAADAPVVESGGKSLIFSGGFSLLQEPTERFLASSRGRVAQPLTAPSSGRHEGAAPRSVDRRLENRSDRLSGVRLWAIGNEPSQRFSAGRRGCSPAIEAGSNRTVWARTRHSECRERRNHERGSLRTREAVTANLRSQLRVPLILDAKMSMVPTRCTSPSSISASRPSR